MKAKKILIVTLVAALIVIGWGIALRSPEEADETVMQADLVDKADAFAERKLYIRAIPLYEEALGLNGSDEVINGIEEKLLDVYQKDNDTTQYVALVQKRAIKGTASEDEQLIAANAFYSSGDIETSLKLLSDGYAKFGTNQFKESYFSIKYAHKLIETPYEIILPSVHNSYMPAFDGSKWGYILPSGKTMLLFMYDYASTFSPEGFAIVKKDNSLWCINTEGKNYSVDDNEQQSRIERVKGVSASNVLAFRDGGYVITDLDFKPVNNSRLEDVTLASCGLSAVKVDGRWKLINGNFTVISEDRYDDVAVNSVGCVFEAGTGLLKQNDRWYLFTLDETGKPIRIGNGFSEAKAPESDELIAVQGENGLWGFIDHTGKSVLDYIYKDAKSFSDGLAAVKKEKKWFYINQDGEKVFDALEFDEAEPFHNGMTQVKNGEYVSILSLDYFE